MRSIVVLLFFGDTGLEGRRRGPREESLLTGAVYLCGFLAAELLKNIAKVFDSSSRSAQALCSGAQHLAALAAVPPRGIEPRTAA